MANGLIHKPSSLATKQALPIKSGALFIWVKPHIYCALTLTLHTAINLLLDPTQNGVFQRVENRHGSKSINRNG